MLDDMEKLASQVSHLIPFIWFRCKGWFSFYGLFIFMVYWTEAYSEPCQTSKMDLFAKIFDEWKQLTIFEKSSILDVWSGSEYASAECKVNCLDRLYYMYCNKFYVWNNMYILPFQYNWIFIRKVKHLRFSQTVVSGPEYILQLWKWIF